MNAPIPLNLGNTTRVADAAAHYEQAFAAADASSLVQAQLHDELRAALLGDSRTVVATPGWGERLGNTPAFEVVQDHFSARSGDADLIALLAVLAGAARGKNVQADAIALIDKLCNEHAEFHAADAVEA